MAPPTGTSRAARDAKAREEAILLSSDDDEEQEAGESAKKKAKTAVKAEAK